MDMTEQFSTSTYAFIYILTHMYIYIRTHTHTHAWSLYSPMLESTVTHNTLAHAHELIYLHT